MGCSLSFYSATTNSELCKRRTGRITPACLTQRKVTFFRFRLQLKSPHFTLTNQINHVGSQAPTVFPLDRFLQHFRSGSKKKTTEQTVLDICACPGRVTKRQSAHCYSNNGRQRPTRDQSPLRGGGHRCHAPCGLRRTEPRRGRIWRDPDVSSRFRSSLLASRATDAAPPCLFRRAHARLASCEQKNVAPFAVIPQERASLEGTVQQKPGHCGC